jgi:hypothetical protein
MKHITLLLTALALFLGCKESVTEAIEDNPTVQDTTGTPEDTTKDTMDTDTVPTVSFIDALGRYYTVNLVSKDKALFKTADSGYQSDRFSSEQDSLDALALLKSINGIIGVDKNIDGYRGRNIDPEQKDTIDNSFNFEGSYVLNSDTTRGWLILLDSIAFTDSSYNFNHPNADTLAYVPVVNTQYLHEHWPRLASEFKFDSLKIIFDEKFVAKPWDSETMVWGVDNIN